MTIEISRPPALNYALIFNASRNCMAVTDKETGVILDVNDQWVTATGIQRSDAIGRKAREFGFWAEPADRAAFMKRMQEESGVVDCEVLFKFEGTPRPNAVNCRRIKTDQSDFLLWEFRNIAEAKLGEEEMLRTRSQLQSILEATPIPLFVKDAHSRFVLMNRACESQWGIPFKDLKDKDGSAIFPPDQMRKFLADDRAIFAGKVPVDFQEVYWNNALQKDRIGHTYKNPIFNAAGEPLYLVCSMVDVTEQEEARHALKKMKSDMDEAQRIAQVGTFVTDLESGTWQTSDSFHLVFGIDQKWPSTVFGWQALVVADDIGRVRSYFRDVMRKGGQFFDVEYRIFRPVDGQIRWVHNVGQVAYNTEKRAIQITGLLQDISPRKESEQLIAQQQNHLEEMVAARTNELQKANLELTVQQKFTRAVADAVPSMIGYWDRDLRCRFANRAYEKWFDLDVESIIGMHIREVLGDRLFQLNHPMMQAALAGEPQEFFREKRLSNGELGYMAAKYIPDIVEGVVNGFYVLIEDVTQIKLAENSLRLLNEELEAQAKLAEQASNAKSDFLAHMSHEIRTPLGAISGMAQLIAKEYLSDSQRDRMKKLNTATRHLGAIINDILDLSKIEANKLVLDESPCFIETLFNNVAGILQDTVQEKGVHLVIDLPSQSQAFATDKTRLQQALLNLASNAVKFTNAGTVRLRGRVQDESGDYALFRFEVQDTGIGIPPEKLEQLFTPFVQADAGTTRRFGGTGLGLAITKRLAEAMGGEVGVQSEVGRGSNFWFTARLKKCDATASEILGNLPADAFAELKSSFSGKRILLVEDDEINREIGTILLEDAGLDVSTAEDGQAALEMATLHAYDLIFMDMQMPKLDGLEATRRIRQTERGSSVPIVAMTANAFSEDRDRCLEAGMNDFVTKPVEPARLYQLLLRQFKGRTV